jgi:mannose-6-phosphate isomerase-like protein (cupin superfamily)
METHIWEEAGYKPLVFFDGWQVALLNWEPLFDPGNLGEIERHNKTDEVFVLLKGRAVLFTIDGTGKPRAEEMAHQVVYNVTQGTWHNLVSSRDASWIIVENNGTHLDDTNVRQMKDIELEGIRSLMPQWVSLLEE